LTDAPEAVSIYNNGSLMTRSDDLLRLPPDLPVPVDDGMASHLPGLPVAPRSLPATTGERVDLSTFAGRTVVYCYPRTGRPDEEPAEGWNLIPGARGCTPQSCAFRDHHRELEGLGARVFGLSTQDTDYQREAMERLHLPFALLSDEGLEFASAMRLPTFEVKSTRLLKRLTLIIRDGAVEHVFYPVFPPDENAHQVVNWLVTHPLN
jgi:peroxiredoxin